MAVVDNDNERREERARSVHNHDVVRALEEREMEEREGAKGKEEAVAKFSLCPSSFSFFGS